jgi:rhamnose utilization protein RhaD (predicted bifunctional aldolase and dehydrogenase)
MIGQHGFISWADDNQKCYLATLDYIERASQSIEAKC